MPLGPTETNPYRLFCFLFKVSLPRQGRTAWVNQLCPYCPTETYMKEFGISQPNNPSHSTPQSQNAKVYKIQAGSHSLKSQTSGKIDLSSKWYKTFPSFRSSTDALSHQSAGSASRRPSPFHPTTQSTGAQPGEPGGDTRWESGDNHRWLVVFRGNHAWKPPPLTMRYGPQNVTTGFTPKLRFQQQNPWNFGDILNPTKSYHLALASVFTSKTSPISRSSPVRFAAMLGSFLMPQHAATQHHLPRVGHCSYCCNGICKQKNANQNVFSATANLGFRSNLRSQVTNA